MSMDIPPRISHHNAPPPLHLQTSSKALIEGIANAIRKAAVVVDESQKQPAHAHKDLEEGEVLPQQSSPTKTKIMFSSSLSARVAGLRNVLAQGAAAPSARMPQPPPPNAPQSHHVLFEAKAKQAQMQSAQLATLTGIPQLMRGPREELPEPARPRDGTPWAVATPVYATPQFIHKSNQPQPNPQKYQQQMQKMLPPHPSFSKPPRTFSTPTQNNAYRNKPFANASAVHPHEKKQSDLKNPSAFNPQPNADSFPSYSSRSASRVAKPQHTFPVRPPLKTFESVARSSSQPPIQTNMQKNNNDANQRTNSVSATEPSNIVDTSTLSFARIKKPASATRIPSISSQSPSTTKTDPNAKNDQSIKPKEEPKISSAFIGKSPSNLAASKPPIHRKSPLQPTPASPIVKADPTQTSSATKQPPSPVKRSDEETLKSWSSVLTRLIKLDVDKPVTMETTNPPSTSVKSEQQSPKKPVSVIKLKFKGSGTSETTSQIQPPSAEQKLPVQTASEPNVDKPDATTNTKPPLPVSTTTTKETTTTKSRANSSSSRTSAKQRNTKKRGRKPTSVVPSIPVCNHRPRLVRLLRTVTNTVCDAKSDPQQQQQATVVPNSVSVQSPTKLDTPVANTVSTTKPVGNDKPEHVDDKSGAIALTNSQPSITVTAHTDTDNTKPVSDAPTKPDPVVSAPTTDVVSSIGDTNASVPTSIKLDLDTNVPRYSSRGDLRSPNKLSVPVPSTDREYGKPPVSPMKNMKSGSSGASKRRDRSSSRERMRDGGGVTDSVSPVPSYKRVKTDASGSMGAVNVRGGYRDQDRGRGRDGDRASDSGYGDRNGDRRYSGRSRDAVRDGSVGGGRNDRSDRDRDSDRNRSRDRDRYRDVAPNRSRTSRGDGDRDKSPRRSRSRSRTGDRDDGSASRYGRGRSRSRSPPRRRDEGRSSTRESGTRSASSSNLTTNISDKPKGETSAVSPVPQSAVGATATKPAASLGRGTGSDRDVKMNGKEDDGKKAPLQKVSLRDYQSRGPSNSSSSTSIDSAQQAATTPLKSAAASDKSPNRSGVRPSAESSASPGASNLFSSLKLSSARLSNTSLSQDVSATTLFPFVDMPPPPFARDAKTSRFWRDLSVAHKRQGDHFRKPSSSKPSSSSTDDQNDIKSVIHYIASALLYMTSIPYYQSELPDHDSINSLQKVMNSITSFVDTTMNCVTKKGWTSISSLVLRCEVCVLWIMYRDQQREMTKLMRMIESMGTSDQESVDKSTKQTELNKLVMALHTTYSKMDTKLQEAITLCPDFHATFHEYLKMGSVSVDCNAYTACEVARRCFYGFVCKEYPEMDFTYYIKSDGTKM